VPCGSPWRRVPGRASGGSEVGHGREAQFGGQWCRPWAGTAEESRRSNAARFDPRAIGIDGSNDPDAPLTRVAPLRSVHLFWGRRERIDPLPLQDY
jgi:hypothetical protein